MQETIKINWTGGMAFEADVMGHTLSMDADPEFGGQMKGPKPKPLMMVALAGCTGMDVVALLGKMRVGFEKLEIEVLGDITEEHPKTFERMMVVYKIYGRNVDRAKVQKAVSLSKEKYCGVSASYQKAMKLEYEIQIVET